MAHNDLYGRPLTPGSNIDPVDAGAALERAAALGYGDETSQMVIGYALYRHARGEEDGAEKTILSHGIDFTAWRVILAAAVAAGTRALGDPPEPPAMFAADATGVTG